MKIEELFGDVKLIQLVGYSFRNKAKTEDERYTYAKQPFMKGWQNSSKPGLSRDEAKVWISQGGWIGMVIPEGFECVDIDNEEEGEYIFNALQQAKIRFTAMKTPNGYQFFFRSCGVIKKQGVKMVTSAGFIVDYRLAGKGQVVLPTQNTSGREWLHLDTVMNKTPVYFHPLKALKKQELRPFEIPVREGSRNDTMYRHVCRLVELGMNMNDIKETATFLNNFFFMPSMNSSELQAILVSAFKHKPSGTNYSSNLQYEDTSHHTEHRDFNLTEMGNAERLVSNHKMNLRYCIEFEQWLIWDGTTWREDRKRKIERIALQTFRKMYHEAQAEQYDERRKKRLEWAKASEKSSVLMNSIERAKAFLPVTKSELNTNRYLLNCSNGMIDLGTGKLCKHERNELITQNTNIPFIEDATCPTWMKFLESILKDERGNVKQELIDFLQKAVGYSLTGDISEQVLFFLWGTGRNGKSTFINIIKQLLGDYGKQANSDTFTSKMGGEVSSGINNDIARLHSARMVSAVESEDGQKLSEALIKQLTGGEPITARFLRKEFFEFTPAFKIWFTTNHKPVIRGDDEGIWRRIRLVPFTFTIPKHEVDKHLPDKLEAELPGILRWAVEGCLKWQLEGLGEPAEVSTATSEYKEDMDLIVEFLRERCVLSTSAKVPVMSIYNEYLEWANVNSEYPMKKRSFSKRLEMKGYMKRRSTGNRTFFFGIGLKSELNERGVAKVTESDAKSPYPISRTANVDKQDYESLNVTNVTNSSTSLIEEEM
ncbi:phage/plasmid primase, P4 family [Bacillus solimangrovi]|uniref:DNA primase n=1 Tax=Bacillus solimangrovi TaxID=1305675 RepID=A0A1E5LEN2_9BACI|nr:phage/plasmid primase, P4 family [Bacillus solimangrovi]OEH92529.1 DNA primase [Bacillus solimangrovi]